MRTVVQAGEKMFDLDETVPLSPLVSGSSPAKSLRLSVQRGYVPARQPDSPTPLPSGGRHPRNSLSRYSQDHHAGSRHSHGSESISALYLGSSEQSVPQDVTGCSLALSSQSTELSVSSVLSSPCPAPRQRRVPMLTGHCERRSGFRLSLDKIQDEDCRKLEDGGRLRPILFEGDPEAAVDPAHAVAVLPALARRDGGALQRTALCAASTSSSSPSPPEPSEQVANIEQSPSSPSAPSPGSTRRMESLRLYCLFAHEADAEIKRSLIMWPDTEFSREMVARSSGPFFFCFQTYWLMWFLRYSCRLPGATHLLWNSQIPAHLTSSFPFAAELRSGAVSDRLGVRRFGQVEIKSYA